MTDAKPLNLVCPRCGHFIPNDQTPGAYPGALSRYSERGIIEVCSQCGGEEAMIQFAAMQEGRAGQDLQNVVHPVLGKHLWVDPEPDIT
jgi:hypothetical protein